MPVTGDWLGHRARRDPDQPALIDTGSGMHTYRELDRIVERTAAGLESTPLGPESNVGIVLPRGPRFVTAVWAIIRIGATVVPLDPSEPPTTVRELLELADVDGLLVDSETAPIGRETLSEDLVVLDAGSLSQAAVSDRGPGSDKPSHGRDLDDTMIVLFTSGTTGERKAVRLTPRNVGASAAGSAFRLGVEPGDRWLLTLPLYHMGGLAIPLRAAIYGTTVVVERQFDPGGTLETMTEYDVTGVSLVPTMLRRLLDSGGVPDSLRFALVGGAPTPAPLVRRALEAGVPLYTTYGMTETASQVATATPTELRADPETVGRPLRTATVSIRDAAGERVPAGKTGAIWVSGPVVSPGYVGAAVDRNPAAPLWTGDVGHLDRLGRLFVTGRQSDVIITGGENVHPETVADALRGLPAVEEAAVVGLSDPEWGQRVAAIVVTASPITPAELRSSLEDHLADHEIPKTIRVVDSIPRTGSGTVDREAVRRRLEADR